MPPEVIPPTMPQPTPTTWTYGLAEMPDGSKLAVIQIYHVTGTTVLFLSGDEAINVGGQLADVGKQARGSGLIVPPNAGGLVSPNGTMLRSVPTPPVDDDPTDYEEVREGLPPPGYDDGPLTAPGDDTQE